MSFRNALQSNFVTEKAFLLSRIFLLQLFLVSDVPTGRKNVSFIHFPKAFSEEKEMKALAKTCGWADMNDVNAFFLLQGSFLM